MSSLAFAAFAGAGVLFAASDPKRDIPADAAVWCHQVPVERHLNVQWAVTAHLRSETFGAPTAPQADAIQTSVSQGRLQFDAWQRHPAEFVLADGRLQPTSRALFPAIQFKESIQARFAVPYRPRQPVKYCATFNEYGESHAWQGAESTPSVAIICREGDSQRCFELSAISWMALHFRWMFCGPTGTGDGVSSLSAEPIMHKGVACRSYTVSLNEPSDEWSLEYLVDMPRRRVCQIKCKGPYLSILDATYANSPSEPPAQICEVPESVSILLMSPEGDVLDELSATRLTTVLGEGPRELVAEQRRAGDVIADFREDALFRADPNGALVRISGHDQEKPVESLVFSKGMYDPASRPAAVSALDPIHGRSQRLDSRSQFVGVYVLRWLAWPNVLIPASSLLLIWAVIRLIFHR